MRDFLGKSGARELDTSRVQYTVQDGRGGYFQNVKKILEFSEERIVLAGKRGTVTIEGNALSLGKCYLGDVSVVGDIKKVERGA